MVHTLWTPSSFSGMKTRLATIFLHMGMLINYFFNIKKNILKLQPTVFMTIDSLESM